MKSKAAVSGLHPKEEMRLLSSVFWELAKDARAVYHVKRIVLVNLDLIDEYLEAFRDEEF